MVDAVKTVPDPLEPLKATIRAYIQGKDLGKTPVHVAFHDLYVAPVPTQMNFGLAWQSVMREIEPPAEATKVVQQPEKSEEQGEPQINTDAHGPDEAEKV